MAVGNPQQSLPARFERVVCEQSVHVEPVDGEKSYAAAQSKRLGDLSPLLLSSTCCMRRRVCVCVSVCGYCFRCAYSLCAKQWSHVSLLSSEWWLNCLQLDETAHMLFTRLLVAFDDVRALQSLVALAVQHKSLMRRCATMPYMHCCML